MSKDKGLPLIQRTKAEQKQPLSFPYWVLVFSATKKKQQKDPGQKIHPTEIK